MSAEHQTHLSISLRERVKTIAQVTVGPVSYLTQRDLSLQAIDHNTKTKHHVDEEPFSTLDMRGSALLDLVRGITAVTTYENLFQSNGLPLLMIYLFTGLAHATYINSSFQDYAKWRNSLRQKSQANHPSNQ